MAKLDYYTVMQKRIEYFAKKYDPLDKFSVKKGPVPEKIIEQKPEKVPNKILAGCVQFISLLF
jgi:hypothetical protein